MSEGISPRSASLSAAAVRWSIFRDHGDKGTSQLDVDSPDLLFLQIQQARSAVDVEAEFIQKI